MADRPWFVPDVDGEGFGVAAKALPVGTRLHQHFVFIAAHLNAHRIFHAEREGEFLAIMVNGIVSANAGADIDFIAALALNLHGDLLLFLDENRLISLQFLAVFVF